MLHFDCVGNIVNFEKIPVPEAFTKGRGVLHSDTLFDETYEILFLDQNLLGNFYETFYSSRLVALKQLVAKHVIYKRDLFDLSGHFIDFLGDRSYYAIHIRRDDFQHKELFISCEEILDPLLTIVPKGAKLYIATDHNDKSFFEPLIQKYQVSFYDDLVAKLQLPHFDEKWIPAIEQLICTRGLKFIGMKYSTFSSYIYRLRGYMDDIADKNYYLNGLLYAKELQVNFREDQQFIANWVREYKDAWNLNHPTIFVSIASFGDPQLIPTIENLFANVAFPERIFVGLHIQDTEAQYRKLKTGSFPNLRLIFTPKDQNKGIVWARNKIKQALFANEDYFLQIESPTRFKKNWDNLLINQLESIETAKPIITTYLNHFEIGDDQQKYLQFPHNSPLRIKQFLSDHPDDNRLRPENQTPLKDYEIKETRWVSNNFLFTSGKWVSDVELPDEISPLGEENLMTIISFRKGYNLRLPSEAVLWHHYTFEKEQTEIDYSMEFVNLHLENTDYTRSLMQLETFLHWQYKITEMQEESVSKNLVDFLFVPRS